MLTVDNTKFRKGDAYEHIRALESRTLSSDKRGPSTTLGSQPSVSGEMSPIMHMVKDCKFHVGIGS